MKGNLLSLALLVPAAVWLWFHPYHVDWTATKVAGAGVCGVSLVLLVVARFQLGASFAVGARAHRLVTTGLYARLRNPIYISGCIFTIGLAVVLGRWQLLVLAMLTIPLQIGRVRNEEKVLEEAFGDEYRAYKARTWF